MQCAEVALVVVLVLVLCAQCAEVALVVANNKYHKYAIPPHGTT